MGFVERARAVFEWVEHGRNGAVGYSGIRWRPSREGMASPAYEYR